MDNWESILIRVDTSIFDVMKVIDCAGSQIAVVVDDSRKILGVITDGDIRRGILRKLDLSLPVETIMNPNPFVASVNMHDDQILLGMQERWLRHVPIINDSGKIIGLKTLDDLFQRKHYDNCVVLMAGGKGSRLGALTKDCPKPLLAFGNKPILHNIIDSFSEFGFNNFYISLHHKSDVIENYFNSASTIEANIQYLKETKKLGTAGSLSLLPKNIDKPIIVMNADVLTKVNFKNLLSFHNSQQVNATACVIEYDLQVPYGEVKTDDCRVVSINEKPCHRFFVSAGIYVLNPEVVNLVPENTYYDMPELLNTALSEKLTIGSFPIHEYWMDIGRPEDYHKANSHKLAEEFYT
ncbi:MAG: nucleotidyltransferase family protein [Gammaproteobacteria bacterium]|jgi:dTDP-glucose pyrophosphorylase